MPYSYAIYTGDGTNRNFTVPCPYINKNEVHIKVDEIEYSDASITWVGDTIVQMAAAPAVGASVRVYRLTDKTELSTIYSTPTVLDHRDLNRVLTQLLYTTQEAYDIGITPLSDLATAIGNLQALANAAQASADDAQLKLTACLAAVTAAQAAQTAAENAAAIAEAVTGIDLSTLMVKSNNLSDVVDKPTARTNLGVPAIADVPTSVVRYAAQTLAGGEQTQARTNIGAYSAAGGVISGAVEVDGAFTAIGAQYFYGYGGFNDSSVVRLNQTGDRYLAYGVHGSGGDYYTFYGAHVYSAAGRLLGTNDASSIVAGVRMSAIADTYGLAPYVGAVVTGVTYSYTTDSKVTGFDGGGAPIYTTYVNGVSVTARYKYLQYNISGSWYTAGYV